MNIVCANMSELVEQTKERKGEGDKERDKEGICKRKNIRSYEVKVCLKNISGI